MGHWSDGRVLGGRRGRHAGRTLANVPLGQIGRVVDGQRAQQTVVARVAEAGVSLDVGAGRRRGGRRRRRAGRRRVAVAVVVRIVRVVAGPVGRRALAVHLHVLAQRRRVRVRLVAAAHFAVVRLIRRVHVRVLLPVGTVGEPPVAAVEFAFERLLAY